MLDALTEVAFEPEFAPSRIEKERKAVVAEAQVGNGMLEHRMLLRSALCCCWPHV